MGKYFNSWEVYLEECEHAGKPSTVKIIYLSAHLVI